MKDDPMNCTKVLRGEQLPWARLTDEDVRLIRQLDEERKRHAEAAKELSRAKVAEKFGVHQRTIENVLRRTTWSHVE